MSRKDYELIAAELAAEVPTVTSHEQAVGFAMAVYAVANALKKDNPRFDSNRFVAAAGL